MTKAHVQHETLRLDLWYPEHEPRESDPHYKLFERARAHMKANTDLWRCHSCGKTEEELGEPLQAHHHLIEYALQNGYDARKFEADHPEFKGLLDGSDEAFYRFVESDKNIVPLCRKHHTGAQGIHVLPYPVWEALRYWRPGQPPPGRKE